MHCKRIRPPVRSTRTPEGAQPRPVPKRYVHRTACADVFLTGWQRVAEDSFTLSARWPPEHPVFAAVCGRWQDPLLIAETVRQSGLLVAHAEYGVPWEQHFLMWELRSAVLGAPPPSGAAAELEMNLSGHEVKRRGKTLASMRYEVVLSQAGRRVAAGGARFSCATPQAYRRVRGPHLGARPTTRQPAPVGPNTVGRAEAQSVVLSQSAGRRRWRLRTDPEHPLCRDHPVDHVPGMVLLEAARQAAEAVTAPGQVLVVSIESDFRRYVEHRSPCWIEAQRGTADEDGVVGVRVVGYQDGEQRFAVTLGVRYCGE